MNELIFTKDKAKMLKSFSAGFKEFMKRKKLTPKQLSKSLGVSDSAVNGWKYGKSFPDVPNLFRLFELGLSMQEILKGVTPIIFTNVINDSESMIFVCQKAIDDLSKLAQNELDKTKKVFFENCINEHLKTIEECKERVSKYKEKLSLFVHS